MSANTRPKVVDERAQQVIRDAAKMLQAAHARVQVLAGMLDGVPEYTEEPRAVTEFTLTADHIKLLRHANVGWDGVEWGAPEIDPKRPFGNGDMWKDVARILGWPPVEGDEGDDDFYAYYDEARAIHGELGTALQIVLATGSFEPGSYVCTKYHRDWRRS